MMQTKRKLAIIGAGSLGVMVLDAAIKAGNYSLDHILFIDDDKVKGTKIHGVNVVGGIKNINNLFSVEYDFIIAIANNKIRKQIAKKFTLNYGNIIPPSAVVSPFSQIGV